MLAVSKYLVYYLRDWKRVPFGCIVATSPENIGVSICCPKDHFNKRRARDIALGRAMLRDNSLGVVPNRRIAGYYGENEKTWYLPEQPMKNYVEECVERIKSRAIKYFKET